MEARHMPLDDLFPADYNPRKALKGDEPELSKMAEDFLFEILKGVGGL